MSPRLDLPGFGLSDKPLAYSYSLFQQADVVEGLLEELGIERAHVVSHDMGTSVHTELLAREHEGRLSFSIDTSTFLNGSVLKGMAELTRFQMLLGYQDGHMKIPAVYSYVRERYRHTDRWIGAMESARAPLQIVWASGDPVAVEAMGAALAVTATTPAPPDSVYFWYMRSTTVKLSVETRDRIRAFGGRTYEETIVDALDVLEADRFWAQAAAADTWRRSLTELERCQLAAREADVDAAFDGIE